MKTILNSISGIFIILLLLFPATAPQAAETTFELQKQIKSDIAQIGKSNQTRSEKTKKLEREIKETVSRISNTIDEGKKKELGNEYFVKRTQKVKAMAEWTVEIEPALRRVAKNMSLLEKEMNSAMPGDKKKGLAPSDREPIKATLKGAGNLLSILKELELDDRRVNNLSRTLMNLDQGYRNHFSSSGHIDLKNQIAFVEELHAYVLTVKQLLMQETNYLKGNVFYLMEDEIVVTVNKFQDQFHAPDFTGFEEEHEADGRILGERSVSERKDYRNSPDLNNIGNW